MNEERRHDGSGQGEVLVILRHAPHGSSWLKEGLDVGLVAAAFGRQVSLLFSGDGVLALVKGQQAGPLGQKGTHPVIEMLAMYDIDNLLVEGEALEARGLTPEDLIVPAVTLAPQEMAEALQGHTLVLNF